VTVGQRRGLGIAAAEPLYVVEIDDQAKRVVVGKKDELKSRGLTARAVSWIGAPPDSSVEAEAQIRYRAAPVACVIRPTATDRCEVEFSEPLNAVTPGQAAVFYRGEQVLGGGWIERAMR
jgi:tRNA-specific 2-thiouridylase